MSQELPPRGSALLIVDDEINVLRSLARLLHPDGHHVLTASTIDQALELLARHDVRVVISDERMVGSTGTGFLARVATLHPGATRILLSGNIRTPEIAHAVACGTVHRLLEKPWDDDEVRAAVAEALQADPGLRGG